MPTEPAYAQTMLNLYEEARLEGARIFDRNAPRKTERTASS